MKQLISGCPQVSFYTLKIFIKPLKPSDHSVDGWIILRVQIIRKDHFIQNAGDHLCFVVFVRHKTVRKLIVISAAVLAAEPADHQSFLHATFLFTDAWTGVSLTERALANRTKMGVLTALNKNTRILLEDQCIV